MRWKGTSSFASSTCLCNWLLCLIWASILVSLVKLHAIPLLEKDLSDFHNFVV